MSNKRKLIAIVLCLCAMPGSVFFSSIPASSKGIDYIETADKCKVPRFDLKGTTLLTANWSGDCQNNYANGFGVLTRTYRNGTTITDTGVVCDEEVCDGHLTRQFSRNNKVDFQYDYFTNNGITKVNCKNNFRTQQNKCTFTDEQNMNGFILGELRNLGKKEIVGFLCEERRCNQAESVLDYSNAKLLIDIFDRHKYTWAPSEKVISDNNELYSQISNSSTQQEQNSLASASIKLFKSYFDKEDLIVYEVIDNSIGTQKSISKFVKNNNAIELLRVSKESEIPVKIKMRISLATKRFKPIADEYSFNFFVILFGKYTVNSGFSSKKEYASLNDLQRVTLKKEDNYTAIVEFDLGDLFLSWSSHIATIHTSDATLDTYDVYSFIF